MWGRRNGNALINQIRLKRPESVAPNGRSRIDVLRERQGGEKARR